MTPVEKAAAIYRSEPCARTFREDLEAHLLHGHVVSTPTAFIMARYVSREWPREKIVDPWWNDFGGAVPNCIHIYLAAGNIKEFFTYPHTTVIWISLERKNHLRFHPYPTLKRLCNTSKAPITPLP